MIENQSETHWTSIAPTETLVPLTLIAVSVTNVTKSVAELKVFLSKAAKHNKARHGDGFSVAASPPLQSCPCWQR